MPQTSGRAGNLYQSRMLDVSITLSPATREIGAQGIYRLEIECDFRRVGRDWLCNLILKLRTVLRCAGIHDLPRTHGAFDLSVLGDITSLTLFPKSCGGGGVDDDEHGTMPRGNIFRRAGRKAPRLHTRPLQ